MLAPGVDLQYGRTLTVEPTDGADTVEIRAASGAVELRLKLTEDGVVLQLEGARISLKAEHSIDLECTTLNLSADSDIRIRGARVFIN
jgi:phage gp45-like